MFVVQVKQIHYFKDINWRDVFREKMDIKKHQNGHKKMGIKIKVLLILLLKLFFARLFAFPLNISQQTPFYVDKLQIKKGFFKN